MVDLHMHSYFSSDGEFTPEELVKGCAEKNIKLMALTDHNTVAGVDRAMAAAEAAGICCLPALEIDCMHKGVSLHILGYAIDHRAPVFETVEKQLRAQLREISRKRKQAFEELGFYLEDSALQALSKKSFWPEEWPPEHFAQLLFESNEYAGHPLLEPYRPGGTRSVNPLANFYWDFCGQGCPCYVPAIYPEAEDIVAHIHSAGGIAVLAHPGVNLRGNESLFPEIISLGIDGVEAYSSYHSLETSVYYAKETRKQGVFVSSGSDYHGYIKPAISLGGVEYPDDAERKRVQDQLLEIFSNLIR